MTAADRSIRATAVVLWVAAAAVGAAAVWWPYAVPPAGDAPVATAAPVTRPATAPAAVSFDDLPDLNLRQPLVDPPPTVAPAVPVAPPPPAVRLAGIVAEPGHSFAVFATPAGGPEVRSVGQRSTAGGAEVVAITPTTVTVRIAGRVTVLRLPPPPSTGR